MQNIILFNSRDVLLRIDLEKIAYFEADGNYTNITLANKQKLQVGINLSAMEERLAQHLGQLSHTFMRIGKRFIVNMQHVQQINVPKQKLVISDNENFTFALPISKDALRNVKELIITLKV